MAHNTRLRAPVNHRELFIYSVGLKLHLTRYLSGGNMWSLRKHISNPGKIPRITYVLRFMLRMIPSYGVLISLHPFRKK